MNTHDITKAMKKMFEENYDGFIVVDDTPRFFTSSISYSSQDFYFVPNNISEIDVYCHNRFDHVIEFKGTVDIDALYDYDNQYDKKYLYQLSVKESYKDFKLLENYESVVYFMSIKNSKTIKEYIID